MLLSRLKTIIQISKSRINPYYPPRLVRFFRSITNSINLQNPKLNSADFQILKCLSNNDFQQARNLLDKMPNRDNINRVIFQTSLLSKYSKNGFFNEAESLFKIMPEKNIVTYNAMLSGYVQRGRLGEARSFFEDMPEKNVVSWTAMLCGLANSGKIDEAIRFFNVMPVKNVVTWNSMIVGLIKNGDLQLSRQYFNEMPNKNQISWNIMIAGYCENGEMEQARLLFDELEVKNVVTWTSLISGYCRNHNVQEAYSLFSKMPERNIVSWTAMIGGLTWNGFYKEALLLFLDMIQRYDTKPNEETLISLAYVCSGLGFHRLGTQLHARLIIKSWDYSDYDGRLSKSLIHMYSMFGIMDFAEFIFSQNSDNFTNVQSCNSMINGYIRIGRFEKAERLFDSLPQRDKISYTLMINGYFDIGEVSKACELFNNMHDKDGIVWTTMISGHVKNELFTEATRFFLDMRAHGVSPLPSSYSVLIGAAGALADLDQGKQFHCMVTKTQPKFDLILENSLISMYAKCGIINDAYTVFLNMIFKDLISWNSMIMGFSHHGLPNEAFKIFNLMLESGFRPNSVTFLGIISACNHGGLVNLGKKLFESMSNDYAIKPNLEHYICMINLLGRAGKVKEAEKFVLKMPMNLDHYAVWGALLGVCGLFEINEGVAKRAAKKVLEVDPVNGPAHVALCNVYAMTGRHLEEGVLRKEMGVKGVKKVPGCSWILIKGKSYVFLCGDKSCPQVLELFLILYGTSCEGVVELEDEI